MNILKLDYPKHEILIHADSHIEKESRAFSCKKEPETVEWIDKYISKNDIVFDVGANIGSYALIMASNLNQKGHVYAFEPSWHNFYQLNRNILLNKYSNKITPVNCALTDKICISPFNYRDTDFGSSLHTFGETVDFVGNKFKPEFSQNIIGFSIDEFVKCFNILKVNHIKIDVDGIEAKIIQGASKVLQANTCTSLMVELNEAFAHDMKSVAMLESFGFKIIKKTPNPSSFYESDTVYNYIFKK